MQPRWRDAGSKPSKSSHLKMVPRSSARPLRSPEATCLGETGKTLTQTEAGGGVPPTPPPCLAAASATCLGARETFPFFSQALRLPSRLTSVRHAASYITQGAVFLKVQSQIGSSTAGNRINLERLSGLSAEAGTLWLPCAVLNSRHSEAASAARYLSRRKATLGGSWAIFVSQKGALPSHTIFNLFLLFFLCNKDSVQVWQRECAGGELQGGGPFINVLYSGAGDDGNARIGNSTPLRVTEVPSV